MNKYHKIFQDCEKKVNSFGLRERVLLLVVALGVLYYLWQALIFDTVLESKEKSAAHAKLIKTQVTQLTEQVNTLAEAASANPKLELTERLNILQQEKKNYEDGVVSLTKQLIPPKEMAKLLGEILAKDNELTLIAMENIPEEAVFKQDPHKQDKQDAAKDLSPKVQIYRHGLKLEFTGSYFATQHFLQALENLPWKLLWGELNYEVKVYPIATVKIIIHTLSMEKSYIGT